MEQPAELGQLSELNGSFGIELLLLYSEFISRPPSGKAVELVPYLYRRRER